MSNNTNSHPLIKLLQKKEKLAIGLISGTSMDGIDTALVKITEFGLKTDLKLLAFETFPYPENLKNFLLSIANETKGKGSEISLANAVVGEYFFDAVTGICDKAGIQLEQIDLIGSHGQTIHHSPELQKAFGKEIKTTLQIGDPGRLAARSGIVTVGLFRNQDMALKGEGAPLVPYFDYLIFRDQNKNRAVLNIGGIANVTLLRKNCRSNEVLAFDTGPGNMVIDGLMRKFYGRAFDRNGEIAERGTVSDELLNKLLTHPYFSRIPPKSTGRKDFGESFVKEIVKTGKMLKLKNEDLIATAAELTAVTICDSIQKYFDEKIDEIIVSGGGIFNNSLMQRLKRRLPKTEFLKSDQFGIPSDAKEAICFAILANECIHASAANLPNVTGAEKPSVLGAIFLS